MGNRELLKIDGNGKGKYFFKAVHVFPLLHIINNLSHTYMYLESIIASQGLTWIIHVHTDRYLIKLSCFVPCI